VPSVLKLGIYIEMHFVDVFKNIITFIEPSKYVADGKMKIMLCGNKMPTRCNR
jgi:hypothetical protein